MKVLILCTGNSCRSQMAQGILQSLDENLNVESAGTKPANEVNPKAIKVMSEIGLDISNHKPELVDIYLNDEWDYVITVCGGAKEVCPAFLGKVKHRLHIGFDDPSDARGSEEYVMNEFRKTRDLIKKEFTDFYQKIKNRLVNMIPDYQNIGNKIGEIIHIGGKEVLELCKNNSVYLIDIREEYETAARQFDIERVIFLPNSELEETYNNLPQDFLLIIADSVGLRSKEAVLFLKEKGYQHIINLAGGIVDWERSGFNVIINPSETLHGQCACMLRSNTGRKSNFK